MTDVLTCPYCGAIQETHEPEQISAMMANTTCEHCGKTFDYSVDVIRTYWLFPVEKEEGEEVKGFYAVHDDEN